MTCPSLSFEPYRKHLSCVSKMEAAKDGILAEDSPIYVKSYANLFYQVLALIGYAPAKFVAVMILGMAIASWLGGLLGVVGFIVYRHVALVIQRRRKIRDGSYLPGQYGLKKSTDVPHYTLIVCGSGGHTGEMIRMLSRSIQHEALAHRRWAVGRGDELSFSKVIDFETRLSMNFASKGWEPGTFDIMSFPRARAVHQSWLTTPFTAVLCVVEIIRILLEQPSGKSIDFAYPGVVVSDGPGSGFLFILVAHILKVLQLVPSDYMQTIFIESWARVGRLSLSGRLADLLGIADMFIVHYRPLARKNHRVFSQNMIAMPRIPTLPTD